MAGSVNRRSSIEVRDQILRAGSEEFSLNGYGETTMRGVATRAGVSMSVLHRHFASKQELFSTALVTPFLQFFEDLTAAWIEHTEQPWDERELTREFVSRLYKNLTDYRLTLVDLLAISEADSQVLSDVRKGLDGIRVKLQALETSDAQGRRSSLAPESAPHANRMIVSLVTGLVVLHPFLTDGGHDDDDQLIETATDLLLNGIRRTDGR